MIADRPGNSILLSGRSIWLSDDHVYDWFFSNRKKIICGFRLVPSVVLSQIAEFFQQMSVSSEVECIGLVDFNEVFTAQQIEFLNNLCVTIYQGNLSQCQILNQIKIVFIQESNFLAEGFYSENTIRVGLSHGVDIPLKKTLIQYGGLMEFDYVLCTKPYSSVADDAFINLTVPEIRTHYKRFCCAVPFGVPKYDKFLRFCQKNLQPTALIYHLSNLKIEHPNVPLIIEDTLRFLLENYPDRTIYFRPFPDDLADDTIRNVHENCKKYPNYKLSDNSCYVEDYAKAKVMICHRDYSDHLFSQASGRPIVVLQPSCFKLDGIGDKIQFLDFKIRLEQCLYIQPGPVCNSSIFNPGGAVRYLLDNLNYIINNTRHPDWQYFELDHPHSVSRAQIISYYLAGTLPFHKVSLRNLELFPQEPDAWMAALTSLGRTPVYANVQLSQMYWMKIVFILQQIIQTNIPMKCYEQLNHWYLQLPRICRQFIREQIEVTVPNSHVLGFLDSWSSADEQIVELTPDLPLFIKNRDLSIQLPSGEVQLYGAGEITRQLLADQRFTNRFDIVRLVDSHPDVQGTVIAGLKVESPESLHQSAAPVLVCSRAYSEEIEYFLRYRLALDCELYVVH